MRLELGGTISGAIPARVGKFTSGQHFGRAYAGWDISPAVSNIWVAANIRVPSKDYPSYGGNVEVIALNPYNASPASKIRPLFLSWRINDLLQTVDNAGALIVAKDVWFLMELHYQYNVAHRLYINGGLASHYVVSSSDPATINSVFVGQYGPPTNAVRGSIFMDDIRVGTTRGASDLAGENFDGPDLSGFDHIFGNVAQINNPYV
jgi:hypothetical protein